jgi:phage shock protein E
VNLDPWLVAALSAVAAVLVVKRLASGRAPAEVVRAKLEAGARVLDVRSAGEFRSGAYPGALNIPLEEVARRAHELPQDRPVVVYCASGLRSGVAVRLLRKAGVTDVVNAGGLAHLPPR